MSASRPQIRNAFIFFAGCILFLLLSVYREKLIPFKADESRRSMLLTGDEPTYLLMAQAIAEGHGMNVRPVHEAESWRAFQQRPVLSSNQWTWAHYYHGWLTPVTDRSREWGNAQKPPFAPLLPVMLAPLVNRTGAIRWWNALLQGLLLCLTAMALVYRACPEGRGRLGLALFVVIAGFGSIPIAYYTAQVFPEILAAVCLLWFLMLGSSEVRWKTSVAAVFLCLSLWATPRVAPAVAVAMGFALWDLVTRGIWRPFLVGLLGVTVFILFNLQVWSSWFPPMGGSFLKHFLGDIVTIEFAQRIYRGTARFFWANDVGLLFFSPLMFAGVVALLLNFLRSGTKTDFLVVCLVVASVATIGLYDDYRAGTCPAGRYQVVVACMLLYALVSSIQRLPAGILRRMIPAIIIFGLLSLAISAVVAQSPHYWYRRYHPLFGSLRIQHDYDRLPSFATGIPNRRMLLWSIVFLIPFFMYDPVRLVLMTMRRRLGRKPGSS